MEKCIGCQFYDRDNTQSASGGTRWGQCRRSAPRLHPVNQKAFMIEGVWPHVRDDDWCGEWRAAAPRADSRAAADRLGAMRVGDSAPAPMRPAPLPSRPEVRPTATGGFGLGVQVGSGAAPGVPAPGAPAARHANPAAGATASARVDLGSLRAAGNAD